VKVLYVYDQDHLQSHSSQSKFPRILSYMRNYSCLGTNSAHDYQVLSIVAQFIYDTILLVGLLLLANLNRTSKGSLESCHHAMSYQEELVKRIANYLHLKLLWSF